ncbi:putative non-specific serine/threonine protein kinase [Helianthus anomalus]
MVLFEVFCGRVCFIKDDDGFLLSAPLVKDYYKKKKLDEIVDPTLREQMSFESMNQFSSIAYQCLHNDRDQRPPMNLVKKELEELLKMEVSLWFS